MAKILRKSLENHEAQCGVFIGQKSIFRHYCMQNVKDGFQIRENKINKEIVTYCSQFISVKGKKISSSISGKVKKIEAQEKLWFA